MTKTRVVRVRRLVRHPVYEKVIRRSLKIQVHDPLEQAHVGDEVLVEETRPLSKRKRWRLVQILRRAPERVEEVSL
jgi:small subunit ribosomal protein S17